MPIYVHCPPHAQDGAPSLPAVRHPCPAEQGSGCRTKALSMDFHGKTHHHWLSFLPAQPSSPAHTAPRLWPWLTHSHGFPGADSAPSPRRAVNSTECSFQGSPWDPNAYGLAHL